VLALLCLLELHNPKAESLLIDFVLILQVCEQLDVIDLYFLLVACYFTLKLTDLLGLVRVLQVRLLELLFQLLAIRIAHIDLIIEDLDIVRQLFASVIPLVDQLLVGDQQATLGLPLLAQFLLFGNELLFQALRLRPKAVRLPFLVAEPFLQLL